MSAGIVYEGVVPQDGSSGGTLFKGMKFWVSHHVPSRVACIQNIKVDDIILGIPFTATSTNKHGIEQWWRSGSY